MAFRLVNSMDQNIPIIVCTSDNHYAMPLAVMLRSLSDRLTSYPTAAVYVLDGGISAWNRRKIQKSIRLPNLDIHWISPPVDRLEGVPVFEHPATLCTYYRLLIPSLLPDSVDKVIFLDTDMVVLTDIGALWNEPVAEVLLMAVEEPNRENPAAIAHREGLGMQPDSKYFNAGVMVINLELWRTEHIAEKALDYIKRKREVVRWYDQDGMNAVLESRWKELDNRWNWRVDPGEAGGGVQACEGHARIVHYASAVKPWHFYAKHPDCRIFFEYLDRTVWKGWRPRPPLRNTIGNRHWYGALMRKIPIVGTLWRTLANWRKT